MYTLYYLNKWHLQKIFLYVKYEASQNLETWRNALKPFYTASQKLLTSEGLSPTSLHNLCQGVHCSGLCGNFFEQKPYRILVVPPEKSGQRVEVEPYQIEFLFRHLFFCFLKLIFFTLKNKNIYVIHLKWQFFLIVLLAKVFNIFEKNVIYHQACNYFEIIERKIIY